MVNKKEVNLIFGGGGKGLLSEGFLRMKFAGLILRRAYYFFLLGEGAYHRN